MGSVDVNAPPNDLLKLPSSESPCRVSCDESSRSPCETSIPQAIRTSLLDSLRKFPFLGLTVLLGWISYLSSSRTLFHYHSTYFLKTPPPEHVSNRVPSSSKQAMRSWYHRLVLDFTVSDDVSFELMVESSLHSSDYDFSPDERLASLI